MPGKIPPLQRAMCHCRFVRDPDVSLPRISDAKGFVN